MTKKKEKSKFLVPAEELVIPVRRVRLTKALRENVKKRKIQKRERDLAMKIVENNEVNKSD